MIYDEFAPDAAAARIVDSYWRFRLGADATEPATHLIVPDATTSLSVGVGRDAASPLLMAGPARRAHVTQVYPGVTYAGVRLRPEAAALLLAVDGPFLRGRLQPVSPPARPPPGLVDVLIDFARFGETASLDGLLARLAEGLRPDAAVAQVAARLVADAGKGQIAALAQGAGISERHLRRRFFDATGMTPKEFAGVRRLREACILAVDQRRTWAEAAAATDYADQAHLSRNVREAFAQTPRRVAVYLQQIDHRFAR